MAREHRRTTLAAGLPLLIALAAAGVIAALLLATGASKASALAVVQVAVLSWAVWLTWRLRARRRPEGHRWLTLGGLLASAAALCVAILVTVVTVRVLAGPD